MRKVFLDDLPKYANGTYKGKIDWGSYIGYVNFIYDDISGKIKIINYNKKGSILTVKYNNYETNIKTGHFSKGILGKILGEEAMSFVVDIGQTFKDNRRDLTIIDRKRIRDKKGKIRTVYKYRCNTCGFNCGEHYKNGGYLREHWVRESNLLTQGRGCACCCSTPQIVVTSINSLFITDMWMIDLGVDKEEAKKFTKSSSKKIKCKCPHCGKELYKPIHNIYQSKSTGCTCGDGFSYPEKFMYSVLKQLGVEFETQYSPNWIKPKKYDFYIPSLNMIIETHGLQHYESRSRGRSLEEEQENDRIKKELALSNGIERYIELDCRRSDMDLIKGSILNNELSELFNINVINWAKCEEYAMKSNIVKEVCNYWKNKKEWETTKDLESEFEVCKPAIVRYLKQGAKLGWCEYDAKEEMRKSAFKNRISKPIKIFNNGELLGEFEEISKLSDKSEELFGVKLLSNSIISVCKGRRLQYKGFTFQYI